MWTCVGNFVQEHQPRIGPTLFVSFLSNGGGNKVVRGIPKGPIYLLGGDTYAFYFSFSLPRRWLSWGMILWTLREWIINKLTGYGKVGDLFRGWIMQQQFDIASTLLDEITKTNFH